MNSSWQGQDVGSRSYLRPCRSASHPIGMREHPGVVKEGIPRNTTEQRHVVARGIVRHRKIGARGRQTPRWGKLCPYGSSPGTIRVGEDPNVIEVAPAIVVSTENDQFVACRVVNSAERPACLRSGRG